MSLPETRVFADAAKLSVALADALIEEADQALAARGVFHLVLAGGTTPRAVYEELARRGAGDARWFVWYGDERCLPPDDPARNSAMIESAWLSASQIPPAQRRPIPAEHGAKAAAAEYSVWLASAPEFDLVLLGLGEDGHTASLFPGHDWNGADVLAVLNAPKPPPLRVSLSVTRLSRSAQVWFMATGSNKRNALVLWMQGGNLPAAAVRGREATWIWLDAAADPGKFLRGIVR